jgi:PIN domain nuclease of toxin-antitoxin system
VNVLLDTHAFLLLSQDVSLLGLRAREVIENEEARVFLSLCSIWEMAIKLKIGKLRIDVPLEEAVNAGVAAGLRLLELRKEAVYRTLSLDLAPRDPFDRILAAQALTGDMLFVSRDTAFDTWEVRRVW